MRGLREGRTEQTNLEKELAASQIEAMAKIVKVRLTEYFPFQDGLSNKEKKREGGVLDRLDKPLHTLEDYMEGKAPFVSVACDSLGGAPGNVKEFRIYGFKVWITKLSTDINSFIDKPVTLPIQIDFRLVDTGGDFHGKGKKIAVSGHEPIDICRRARPASDKSFSGMLTELMLVGKP